MGVRSNILVGRPTFLSIRRSKRIARKTIRKMFRVKSTRRNLKRASPDAATATAAPATAATAVPAGIPTSVPIVLPAAVAPVASVPPTAKPKEADRPTTSNTVEFFAAESAATALSKPWLRLERGLRLQRFRAYSEAYPGLTDKERVRLNEVLVAANDKKLLNTKQQVTYENGVILSIRGLKIIRTGDTAEPAVIKIEPPRLTKRNTEDV